MGSGSIVALIITGIVVMVVVAFIAQAAENARQERHRRVLILLDYTRQLWTALGIPPQYLTQPLRQLMLNELRRCYREVLALEAKNAVAKGQLRNLDQFIEQPFEPLVDTLKPAFNDHMSGQKIRSDLKSLVNLLVQLHNDGLLDKSLAQQHINTGKALYSLASIDLSLLTAREMEHSDNPRAAHAHYSTSLKNLNKINPYLPVPTRIAHIQNKLEGLKSAALEQRAARSGQQAEDQQEWDELMKSEQSDWKIKQDYE